jgi:XTP/dITP diphosphohydrolase
MLPASTGVRKARDGLRKDSRSVEIQRLIGRSLRQAVDLTALGERTITIDCDVLEADGGTRTAAITGGFVALCLAIRKLQAEGKLRFSPIRRQIAAVSCGLVGRVPLLDLCYAEDSGADADMNLVMNDTGAFVEIQGTGESRPFTKEELDTLIAYGQKGIRALMAAQRDALGGEISHLPVLAAATGNPHKLAELQELFGAYYDVICMKDLGCEDPIAETGETFAQNAALKAETVCRLTGLAALADDSGLTVEALGGAPGVYSARYAGEPGNDRLNNETLLAGMRGQKNRAAAFVSALAWARPDRETVIVTGTCPGLLLEEARGAGGFGYDPLFLYEDGLTFAQMPPEQKNRVSHRARAVQAMLERMQAET